MKLEWGLTAGNAEGEVDRLLAVSRKAEGGLPLTEAQARAVAQAHGEALRRTGRIEFGKSAAEKLVEIFAGSPWLTREEQGQHWRRCSTTAVPSCRTACLTAGCWNRCAGRSTAPAGAAWS